MNRSSLVLLWLFALSSFSHADAAAPLATNGAATAQTAEALSKTALNQASAGEKLARRKLGKANKALAKKPSSAAAAQAVAAAQKELVASAAVENANAELREKTALAKIASKDQTKNKAGAAGNVPIYPEDQYKSFVDEYETAQRVDAYFFFNDPFDFKNKTVMLDAKFDEMISPGVAKFTIWRNFGKMHLIVSNVPMENVMPKDKSILLAGIITGFRKEVVSGELVLNTELKLKGLLICKDSKCDS